LLLGVNGIIFVAEMYDESTKVEKDPFVFYLHVFIL
jgi:hypothetical protein